MTLNDAIFVIGTNIIRNSSIKRALFLCMYTHQSINIGNIQKLWIHNMYLRIIQKMLVNYTKIKTIGSDNKLPLYWYLPSFYFKFLNLVSRKLVFLMISRN